LRNKRTAIIYHQRIDTVITYVRNHLVEELPLEILSRVAGFSPFHFHRIFKSITGETLAGMVTRLRLERAATLLRATPQLTITDAAFACGFHSVAVFSRSFKKQYGIAASRWDRAQPLNYSKIGQKPEDFPRYTVEELCQWAKQDSLQVRLRLLPAQKLAYLRIYDSYRDFSGVIEAYERLLAWYEVRGGQLEKTTLYGMSQDDPEITPLSLCRFDWCLAVPMDWQAEGEVNVIDFPACRVAMVHCQGDLAQEDRALQFLFRYWLPHSHYQPANLPAMEIYRRQPAELGWACYDMDCAVPIERL